MSRVKLPLLAVNQQPAASRRWAHESVKHIFRALPAVDAQAAKASSNKHTARQEFAMSKREISMFAAQGVDVDAPRAKRQRTAAAAAPGSSGAAAGGHTARANGGQAGAGEGAAHGEDQATVKEKGMKLWQTVKEATDKECVTILGLSCLLQFGNDSTSHFAVCPPNACLFKPPQTTLAHPQHGRRLRSSVAELCRQSSCGCRPRSNTPTTTCRSSIP